MSKMETFNEFLLFMRSLVGLPLDDVPDVVVLVSKSGEILLEAT